MKKKKTISTFIFLQRHLFCFLHDISHSAFTSLSITYNLYIIFFQSSLTFAISITITSSSKSGGRKLQNPHQYPKWSFGVRFKSKYLKLFEALSSIYSEHVNIVYVCICVRKFIVRLKDFCYRATDKVEKLIETVNSCHNHSKNLDWIFSKE